MGKFWVITGYMNKLILLVKNKLQDAKLDFFRNSLLPKIDVSASVIARSKSVMSDNPQLSSIDKTDLTRCNPWNV